MSFIDKIFLREELALQPPVLLDIGASGAIHFRWKKMAKYCICIAFDPDKREYSYIESENKNYKKLYIFNCVVSDVTSDAQTFYLTASPYCSSFLKPREDKLAPYAFANKFKIEREAQIAVRSLTDILQELNISYIDWFKTDSQGLDLRIFKSLPDSIIHHVLAAEFEPGIMDAYLGEDKLHSVLAFMEAQSFFLSVFKVKGSSRLSPVNISMLASNTSVQKLLAVSQKAAAGWGELLYLNTFDSDSMTIRDYLLGVAIALMNEEYGFAMELAQSAGKRFNDPFFREMEHYAGKKARRAVFKLRFVKDVKKKIFKEQ